MNVDDVQDPSSEAQPQPGPAQPQQAQQAQGIDPTMLAAFSQMFTHVVTANQSTAVSAAVAAVQAAKSKESEPKEDLWDTYLQEAEVAPTTLGATRLVSLLEKPPDLTRLELTLKEVPHYKGLPRTAPPKSHPQDKLLHKVQEKLHAAMCCLVDAEENNDISSSSTACAFLRGAHQDVLQMRRLGAAGKQAHKLDRREDASDVELFTTAEQKKLNERGRFGKGKGKQNGKWNSSSTSSRGKGSQNRSSGGKGKGNRARSQSQSGSQK